MPRPLVLIDVKLRHRLDPETGEALTPDAYVTPFAFRDFYTVTNRYVDATYEAGALPLLMPPYTDEETVRQYVNMADGFVCVGINDYPPDLYREPKRMETAVKNTAGYRLHAESNMMLARMTLQENDRMPVLGICAGPELFNIALGGKLIQHLPTVENHIAHSPILDREHEIEIRDGHVLAGLFGKTRLMVNTNHHQAADPEHMGEGLVAAAFTDDGVVEAVECVDPDRYVLGTQWHPERVNNDEIRDKVFGAFMDAAREYRESVRGE